MTDTKHTTVLLNEAVDLLNISNDSVVVDATLGAGGHAKLFLETLDTSGVYVGIDADLLAVEIAEPLKSSKATVHLENANFSKIDEVCQKYEIKPTAILADLGWRSEQFADPMRGFSFQKDGPLQMTYGNPADHTFTTYDIVNDWEESSIADIIYGYGEERYSRRIAQAIVRERQNAEIKTTFELVKIIQSAVPAAYRRGRIHPATKTFQAFRIAVNDELGVLKELIEKGFSVLEPGGRMAIISFHSLEDRIAKRSFVSLKNEEKAVLVTKKPVTPTIDEIKNNPRARSAKLRVIEKI